VTGRRLLLFALLEELALGVLAEQATAAVHQATVCRA
jgi:hypothetical protein